MAYNKTTNLGVFTANVVGKDQPVKGDNFAVAAWLSGAGGAATVQVQGSIGDAPWQNVGSSMALTGANDAKNTIVVGPWPKLRANISGLSGGAIVNVAVGHIEN